MHTNVIITKRFVNKCRHGKYIVDESLNTVECGICGKELNPVWVLAQFAHKESRMRDEFERLQKINEKAAQKNRCKCEKCGEMTRIQK